MGQRHTLESPAPVVGGLVKLWKAYGQQKSLVDITLKFRGGSRPVGSVRVWPAQGISITISPGG